MLLREFLNEERSPGLRFSMDNFFNLFDTVFPRSGAFKQKFREGSQFSLQSFSEFIATVQIHELELMKDCETQGAVADWNGHLWWQAVHNMEAALRIRIFTTPPPLLPAGAHLVNMLGQARRLIGSAATRSMICWDFIDTIDFACGGLNVPAPGPGVGPVIPGPSQSFRLAAVRRGSGFQQNVYYSRIPLGAILVFEGEIMGGRKYDAHYAIYAGAGTAIGTNVPKNSPARILSLDSREFADFDIVNVHVPPWVPAGAAAVLSPAAVVASATAAVNTAARSDAALRLAQRHSVDRLSRPVRRL